MGDVDMDGLGSGTYPRARGHRERDAAGNLGPEIPGAKVDGKEFEHLLQTPDEPIQEQPATPPAPVKP